LQEDRWEKGIIMNTFAEQASKALEKLGQAFLIAGYLPAAIFILAHQLFLFPRWLGKTVLLFQTPIPEQSTNAAWSWTYLIDQTITLLLLPLLLGILLMALNTVIIRLYEGAYSWQQRFLLLMWQQNNETQAELLYGDLVKLKEAYTARLAERAALSPEDDAVPLERELASIALEIQYAHAELQKQAPVQRLPRRVAKVKPTLLGNAFAVAEEYPYERYGIDSVLFWPRLRPLVDEAHATTLVNTKMILDLLLHTSLLALVFGLESAIIGAAGGPIDWALIGVGMGAWLISYLCYQGAVSTVYSLGNTIAVCFDYFRGRVLEKYGIARPTDIHAEQHVWLQLGQFLRRGEGFYFPPSVRPEKTEPGQGTDIAAKPKEPDPAAK